MLLLLLDDVLFVVRSGMLFSCVCGGWSLRCCCLLFVGRCSSCGVVCLLSSVSLIVRLRIDMLCLTLRVVSDMCCDVFDMCVVRCLTLSVVEVTLW